MNAFIHGIFLSLGLILPLGVQNIFVFNQGVTQMKWRHALPSIMTAFVCDAILIMSAIMGVSMIVLKIPGVKAIVYSLGLVFLSYMGWVTWNSSTVRECEDEPLSAYQQVAFAASVSLLNPHAIIDTIGVIGTNSLQFAGDDKLFFTIACLLVSLTWFTGLSLAGYFIKSIDKSGRGISSLNKLSALIIWSVAIYIGVQLIA